jgi:hypothetical protein
MEVGDKKTFPVKTFREKQRIRSAATGHGALHGKHFTCRLGNGEIHVTRVE